ncbi:MAG: ribose-5-phosphate isomerase RpiA [Pseudomonadota bacterium]
MAEDMANTQSPDALSAAEQGKRAAAIKALEWVEDGMKLGLGTGSTAKWFVDLLAPHLADTGKRVVGVPTSSRTRTQAEGLGIPLSTLGELGSLDVTIDGADEFDPALNLIKGGGGALLQEKIVASSSDRMVVITDPSKEVASLGAYDLPVEVICFGWQATVGAIAEVLEPADVDGREIVMRMEGDQPYVTDEGHYIFDLKLGRIGDPDILGISLNQVPGVVETGLFCGLASVVIIGEPGGTARVVEGGSA